MAKIKYGPLIGQASGSVGATTFSHNRFGSYTRNRSIPTQPNSGPQLLRRAALSTISAAWALRSVSERLAWKIWAQNNPMTDKLGDKRILTGHMAYVQLNSRLLLIAVAAVDTPPVVPTPTALTAASIIVSVAANTAAITFAPTPLGADARVFVTACKTPTATINYTKNLMRYIAVSAAAQTTPYTIANVGTLLGSLTVGENSIFWLHVIDDATGLLSPPREVRTLVVA